MEALAKVDTDTVIKQTNSIVLKHSDNKVCKNRIEMPFKELIKHISEKLMAYAMLLANKDEDDALSWVSVYWYGGNSNLYVPQGKGDGKFLDKEKQRAYLLAENED